MSHPLGVHGRANEPGRVHKGCWALGWVRRTWRLRGVAASLPADRGFQSRRDLLAIVAQTLE